LSHIIYLLTFLLTYLLTYLLTPRSRILLEKVTRFQLVKKLPSFYGNRKFITAFGSVLQVRVSCLHFVTGYVFGLRSCQHLAHPQAGGLPLLGSPRLLIQYVHSYPPYWRPFLRPQI